jgi:PhzF family phenazine biosynthesis protein
MPSFDLPMTLVDAFTDRPFSGNPAAVFPLAGPLPEDLYGLIAMEMNQAESAFTWVEETGHRVLRWFTPTVEVDLCGHATLAAAHVLMEQQALAKVEFETRSGKLTVLKTESGYAMDFPSEAPTELVGEERSAVLDILHAAGFTGIEWVGANRMDTFVRLALQDSVTEYQPRMDAIASLGGRGLIVTAPAEENEQGIDFVSRFFAPQAGVPEDPVTGSAHCALGPYWSEQLGRPGVTGFQASRRGGVVSIEVMGKRCLLKGNAVTTVEGRLWV